MKQITTVLLSLLFVQSLFAQATTMEELVTGMEKMVKENAEALEPADKRVVRRSLQEVRLIFADYGIFPSTNTEVSRVFSCTTDSNPKLVREVIDQGGNVLRYDVMQVFTQGYSSDKKAACQAELGQSSLGGETKGVCRCGQESNPILWFEMVNTDFQTVREMKITEFSTGYTSDKIQACEDMKASLAICTGI